MNFFVVFFVGLLAIVKGRVVQNTDIGGRIVNGVDAKYGDIPYQVALQKNFEFHCSGSIVNENWIVTAAQCLVFSYPNRLQVLVGTIDLYYPYKIYMGERSIVHKNYKEEVYQQNDIGLLKVRTPIEFDETVQPVPLPKPHHQVKTNETATVSGWGALDSPSIVTSNKLQMVNISITDQEFCRKLMLQEAQDIFPTNICAYDPNIRKGQCSKDTGGPLMVKGQLIGIVSWIITDPYCGSTKYPGVYTRVTEYVDWILDNTK